MARGINKVILVGNLGADPEKRETPSGLVITNVRLATTEQWTDKQTGDKKDNTEWHRVVFFGRLGEIAAQYLHKGSQVYVEGRLQTRKWQGQDGQDRYTTEIVANEMQMLGGRSTGGAPEPYGETADRTYAENEFSGSSGRSSGGSGAHRSSLDDDDVPF